MRRVLVRGLAAFAVLAGWVFPADATQPVPANLPVTATVAPDALLKSVTLEVTAIIRQDKDVQAGNPAKVAELVETRILPHFDFTRMTRIAVARNWRRATPEQQKTLTAEYKALLVRTYSSALSSYRNQVIEYKPLRAAPGATEVTVRSTVKQPGAERTTIDYDMEKTAAGWKVYDIKIAGISLNSTYQPAFGRIIHDGGVDGLIESLSVRNRQADDAELGSRMSSARPFLFILYAVIPGIFHSGR
jgi:phospholipid transport system substrate-binding protein